MQLQLNLISATKLIMIVGLLTLNNLRPLYGQIYQRYKHHNSTFMTNLMIMLKSATYNAEKATNYNASMHKGRSIFYSQGNIYDVEDEVKFYAQSVAHLPNISIVCETGFNAGHSAITFLYANPKIKYIGFDLGDMPWSEAAVNYVKYLFGDRFEYHKGYTKNTLLPEVLNGQVCDFLSVDADHSNAYGDFVLGQKVTRPNAYVLADDYSSDCPPVIRDWARAQKEGMISTLSCHKDAFKIIDDEGGYYKGWCLGQYVK
jgi:hypothetical protein